MLSRLGNRRNSGSWGSLGSRVQRESLDRAGRHGHADYRRQRPGRTLDGRPTGGRNRTGQGRYSRRRGLAWRWAADGPLSAWIAIDATTVNNAPVIPYTYYRSFSLAAVDVPLASISGTWGIDDGGDLKLNGNVISSSPADYTATTPFSVAAGGGLFVAGVNLLTITMTTSDNVWEAVRLEGSLTVPEPSTWLMASTAVVLVGCVAGWRKRLKRPA